MVLGKVCIQRLLDLSQHAVMCLEISGLGVAGCFKGQGSTQNEQNFQRTASV
jgi:hypothetical protein